MRQIFHLSVVLLGTISILATYYYNLETDRIFGTYPADSISFWRDFVLQRARNRVILQSSPCVFAEKRNAYDGRFYNLSTTQLRFFAYSAFYDDRPSLLTNPVIRIIAITDKIRVTNRSLGLICVLFHSSGTTHVAVEEDPRPCGPDWVMNGRPAQPYVYSCPTEGLIPHAVSIQGNGVERVSSCMPVEFPRKPKEMKEFILCVPASYDHIDPMQMIEWMEMQKILGIDGVGVYDLDLSNGSLEVLRYYSNEGFVELRKLDSIYEFDIGEHIVEATIGLNDCLYRHMYEAKYIVVSDFDEFIRPKKHKNLSEMVSYLELARAANKSPNYLFRNVFFFLDSKSDETRILRFLEHRKGVISKPLERVKPIIRPEACTHFYNHGCLGSTENYSGRPLHNEVDPGIGFNQHHRKCFYTPAECEAMMRNASQDDGILLFKDALTTAVADKIRIILGKNS